MQFHNCNGMFKQIFIFQFACTHRRIYETTFFEKYNPLLKYKKTYSGMMLQNYAGIYLSVVQIKSCESKCVLLCNLQTRRNNSDFYLASICFLVCPLRAKCSFIMDSLRKCVFLIAIMWKPYAFSWKSQSFQTDTKKLIMIFIIVPLLTSPQSLSFVLFCNIWPVESHIFHNLCFRFGGKEVLFLYSYYSSGISAWTLITCPIDNRHKETVR